MQSKYVGDKPDFGKFGLLRFLTGLTDPETPEPDLRLGVVWYLTPDDCCGNEGRSIGYLEDTPANRREFRDCDPTLWDELRGVVDRGERCVHRVPNAQILPAGTSIYDIPLHFPPYMLRPAREANRTLWLAGAKQAVQGATIIFLDPDTGLAPEEKKYRKEGPKYTYMSDIEEFWGCGKSVIVYQHPGRNGEDERIREKNAQIREMSGVAPLLVRFRGLVFFILPQPHHRGRIEQRVRRMTADECQWSRFFTCPMLQPQQGGQP